jgi:hypothetical protein
MAFDLQGLSHYKENDPLYAIYSTVGNFTDKIKHRSLVAVSAFLFHRHTHRSRNMACGFPALPFRHNRGQCRPDRDHPRNRP